jgi:hypothetical protein
MNPEKAQILGWRDKIDFPSLHLQDVPVKIDTGARTSSLHCHNPKIDGDFIIFSPLPDVNPQHHGKRFRFRIKDRRLVRNSFGQVEWRFFVRTKIRILERSVSVTFSLADRSSMEFPVLLGRNALRKRFLVDVSLADCSYNAKYNLPPIEDADDPPLELPPEVVARFLAELEAKK